VVEYVVNVSERYLDSLSGRVTTTTESKTLTNQTLNLILILCLTLTNE